MLESSQGEISQQFHERLQNLKREFSVGQEKLAHLDGERANLRDTLLRISGAIQVLEELLANDPSKRQADVRSVEAPPASS